MARVLKIILVFVSLLAVIGLTVYLTLFINERELLYFSMQRRGQVAQSFARGVIAEKGIETIDGGVWWASFDDFDLVQIPVSDEDVPHPTVIMKWDPSTRTHTLVYFNWALPKDPDISNWPVFDE